MQLVKSEKHIKNDSKQLPGTIISDDGDLIILHMTVDEWLQTQNHPRQRDTVRHGRAIHWREAKTSEGVLKTHLGHVVGAILNDTLFKIDGHTRAHLWETGVLERPSKIVVTTYRVKDRDELNALYGVMDLSSAAERPSDQVYGAYRDCDLVIQSQRLRGGNISEALHLAIRGEPKARRSKKRLTFDVYEAVRLFKTELKKLDAINPDPKIYPTGILAAALIMLALYPKTLPFFRLLNEKNGEKKGGRMDPVEATLDLINEMRYSKQLHHSIGHLELCARCIRAVFNWLEGPESSRYWLKNKVYAYDVKALTEELRKKKKIIQNEHL